MCRNCNIKDPKHIMLLVACPLVLQTPEVLSFLHAQPGGKPGLMSLGCHGVSACRTAVAVLLGCRWGIWEFPKTGGIWVPVIGILGFGGLHRGPPTPRNDRTTRQHARLITVLVHGVPQGR